MKDFQNVTTADRVSIYLATKDIFKGLLSEVRELSKKKPDAVMSKGKVSIINRVLEDLKQILVDEPEAKFLDLLSDHELPQTSDAVLVMVQYETALAEFPNRYRRSLRIGTTSYGSPNMKMFWITDKFINDYRKVKGDASRLAEVDPEDE
ncbi:hypothetical protein ASG42_26465 [Rhizobium sp. Leaf391]|uniref:hypothetical protein n=1 Tax=Rhizobium sp. Leaf391 TaxID=1736360 RepID=UPI0007130760|nr:hypothetical protein [Rhizobium sp. Leaf391]KQT01564.1 hypothetical protein ASG42_26465 [Rhizobium sp. Leaf391]